MGIKPNYIKAFGQELMVRYGDRFSRDFDENKLTVAELTMEDMGDLSDPSPALAALVRQATGAIQTTLKLQSLSTSGAPAEPPPTS